MVGGDDELRNLQRVDLIINTTLSEDDATGGLAQSEAPVVLSNDDETGVVVVFETMKMHEQNHYQTHDTTDEKEEMSDAQVASSQGTTSSLRGRFRG